MPDYMAHRERSFLVRVCIPCKGSVVKANVILLFGIFVLGCGNGSSELKSSESLLPPEFDLTGNWIITEIDCNAVGNVDGEIISLESIASVVEQEALHNPETRFVQDGNKNGYSWRYRRNCN